MKPLGPLAPSSTLAGQPRGRSRASGSLPALPLGTAVYDADVQQRTRRLATELIDAFPDAEPHVERLQSILERALHEQDRASRADEVLRRFSPSVQSYVRRQAGSSS